MRLTIARLRELQDMGLTREALTIYVGASCWVDGSEERLIPCAALANLPMAPRGKSFNAATAQLLALGLMEAVGDGYHVPEQLTPDAARMRERRANRSRTDGERVREQFGNSSRTDAELFTNNGRTASEQTPAPPLSLSPDLGLISASSSALSSGSKPESKRARGAQPGGRKRFVPDDWSPKESHFKLASELGLDIKSQVVLFREWEFKDPKSDWDKTFFRWLRKASTFVGERPGVHVPGANFNRLRDRAAQLEAEEKRNAAQ